MVATKVPDSNLVFERISTDTAISIYRASISGGWLVQGYLEAGSLQQDGYLTYDNSNCRIALTFVPDVNHLWNKPPGKVNQFFKSIFKQK